MHAYGRLCCGAERRHSHRNRGEWGGGRASYIGARWPGQHDTAIFVGGNGTHGLCSGKGGSEARRGGGRIITVKSNGDWLDPLGPTMREEVTRAHPDTHRAQWHSGNSHRAQSHSGNFGRQLVRCSMMIETQNNSTTMIGVRVNSGKKFGAHARLCIFSKVELCFVAITRAQLNTSGIIHA